MRKDNPVLKVNQDTQVVNLGSTYAYYDIEYKGFGIYGVNLANFPQYLDYDKIILEKVTKKLKKGTKVILTFPDFVFAGIGTNPDRRQYYEVLAAWEMKCFSVKSLIFYMAKAAIEPFTHSYQRERDKWKGYVATDKEKYGYALKRIHEWEDPNGQVQIPNVKKADITWKHLERIEENKRIVMEMLVHCVKNELEPYFLVFPISDIMKSEIADECLEVYLREPLNAVLEDAKRAGYNVRLLDYSEDEDLSDMRLYMNGDCFNAEGRHKFTGIVLKDIGLMK